MLKLRYKQGPRHFLQTDTSLKLFQSQCRNISSTPLRNFRKCSGSSRQFIARSQPSWPTRQHLRWQLNPAFFRFASTDSRPAPVSEVQSAYPSTASQPVPDASPAIESATSESPNLIETPRSIDSIVNNSQPQVNEYIGYLKDMGLDYGWGPTALVETFLEHVHIYSGTPWWASIALTVIAIRLSIFKLYINAQDSSARQTAVRSLITPLDKRQRIAMAASDQQEIRAIQEERKTLYKKYGIKISSLIWPLVVQVPIGFGTFRLMRGMAALPVPDFDQGGFLWLSDLTSADPLYILPLVTAATYFWTFKLGGETGGAASNMSPTTYRIFCYVLPTLTGIFAMWWPVGLQIPIFLNGIFAITQNILFRQPWFRNFCGIQPLGVLRKSEGPISVNRGLKSAKPESKGFADSLKTAYNEAVEQGRKFSGKASKPDTTGRTDAEAKKAKAYEEKVAREAAQRRFEAKQAKQAREEERRQRSTLD